MGKPQQLGPEPERQTFFMSIDVERPDEKIIRKGEALFQECRKAIVRMVARKLSPLLRIDLDFSDPE